MITGILIGLGVGLVLFAAFIFVINNWFNPFG